MWSSEEILGIADCWNGLWPQAKLTPMQLESFVGSATALPYAAVVMALEKLHGQRESAWPPPVSEAIQAARRIVKPSPMPGGYPACYDRIQDPKTRDALKNDLNRGPANARTDAVSPEQCREYAADLVRRLKGFGVMPKVEHAVDAAQVDRAGDTKTL